MSYVPDVSHVNLKLREMTLQDEISNSDEKLDSIDNRNSVEVNLSPTLNSESSTETYISCSEFTFDNVIGHLEDMLIDEEFQALQNSFLEKYWKEFDNSEENKHSYMIIFNEYTNKIEDFIVSYLKKRVVNFEMDIFTSELEKKKNSLEGELFEVLLTLSDFNAFKEIFLDYRAMKEGNTIDLGKSLSVSSVKL